MKTNRFVALLMALALILSLASLAQADEKPATWLSDELVEIRVMRGENALQPILQDNIKLKTIEELLNVRLIVEVAPDANYDDKKSTLIATDDMPDLMLVDLEDVRKYARDDMFVNLSEHRDEMPNFFALIDENRRGRQPVRRARSAAPQSRRAPVRPAGELPCGPAGKIRPRRADDL